MKRWVVLFIALAMLSCKKNAEQIASSTSQNQNSGSGGTTNSGSGFSAAANLDTVAMLALVNNIRSTGCTCGTTVMPAVAALKWNNILTKAAIAHSNDMNATGDLSHNSSDGTSFSVRITNAGYTKWTALGENIASGQTTVQQVFNSWLASEGHCENMMSASYIEMGAARAGNYWTQDFGHP